MTNSIFQETDQTTTDVLVRPKKRSKRQPDEQENEKSQKEPKFHVIVWNDDDHTFQYVVELLQALFGYPPEKGWQLAVQVDATGKAIVYTSSLERAEIKRDQILAFGPDPYTFVKTGPLIATLEKNIED